MNKSSILKITTCVLLVFGQLNTNAQADNDLQIATLKNVMPPSPNASSIGKYGEWPVALYTGVPSINLPICELKGRTLTVPVALAYHASGNRVGETPSWVGLGWSLIAGGAVTRSVRGLPDENNYFSNAANHSNPDDFGSAVLNSTLENNHIFSAVKNGTDTQEDIYSFNALGKSYKFILKANGTIQTIPASSVKLLSNPMVGPNLTTDTWTILLEDGTKLLFGGTNYTELTVNPRFFLSDGSNISFTSSWMLQSITTTSNEVISFTYTQTSINQDSYYSQSDYTKYATGCQYINESPSTKTTVEKQTVLALNLSTIESELGRIEFILSNTTRQDLPGNKPLQEIKVYSKLSNKYIEDYILTTGYSTAVSSNVLSTPATINDTYINYRLRLNSLERKDPNNPTSPGQKWAFDYNSQNLPARRSFAQDHWGFFNGATTNTTLMPSVYYAINPAFIPNGHPELYGFMPPAHDIGANREGDPNYLQAEMLTTIHYPTGGNTNFTYEANSIPVTGETFTKTNLSLALNMFANQNPPSNSSTVIFTITKPQYVNLSATSFISAAILVDQPNAKTTTEVLNQAGTSIASFINADNKWFNLIAAGTYTLKVSANVQPSSITGTNTINVNATLKYDQSNGVQSYNKLVGGLRINKMADYDGISSSGFNEKNFVYESPIEISPIDLVNDYLATQGGVQTGSGCNDSTVTRNSSSRFALGSIQGGTVAYGKVTTLFGSGATNGKTVSLFTNEPDEIPNGALPSHVFPYPPADSKDHRRGLLLEETHYKSDLVTPLSKTTHTYSFNVIGYIKGVKYAYIVNTNILPECLCSVRGGFVTTTSEQVKHLTSTEVTYDMNGLNPLTKTTNYFYDNPNNFQPVHVETTDSKNNLIKIYNRTALEKTDINAATPLSATASAAIDAMVSNNMLSQAIQQEKQNAGSLVSRSLINYKVWPNNIPAPETIDLQIGANSKETRVQFTSYDNKGNVLSQQKQSDVAHSYIYDYSLTYPIAEILSGSPADVAYTSFEADGNGGWSGIVSPGFAVNGSITGKKAYTQTSFSISKSGLSTSTTYLVSYWSKNGAYSVNGSTATSVRVLNGWTLYQHSVTNPASGTITVSGTGTIDELRLYPSSATMKTYTYEPLIGVSSICDENNHIISYYYDGFSRPILIKDETGNIIKKYCYNYTNQAGDCSLYGNAAQNGIFTRNNCTAGFNGSQVTYSVPTNLYYATTQIDANALAASDVTANGQDYANVYGTCTAQMITITGSNNRSIGYTVTFTLSGSNPPVVYSFSLPSGSSNATLGQIPKGTYNIQFQPGGQPVSATFGVGSSTFGPVTGGALFNNISLQVNTLVRAF